MTYYNEGIYKISNSEIKCFRNCQREWLLHYCWQWSKKSAPEDASGALKLGSAVHESLEHYYRDHQDPIVYLRSLYEKKIKEAQELGYFASIIDGIRKEGELAQIMVSGLLEWEAENGLDENMELIGVEKTLEHQLPNGAILKGKLDQQWRKADGRIIFRDWKTCKNFSDLDDSFLFNEQIKMYELLERLSGDQVTDGAQFVMLRKVKRTGSAKPPFYKHVEVRPNAAEIESMFRRTVYSTSQIMDTDRECRDNDDIKVAQYYCPPRPSRDCRWRCPFFQVCPLMDDGSNWRGLLHERFEHVNPDTRYDEGGDKK